MSLQSYKELIVWQRAIELVTATYYATKQLPDDERYGLVTQMRRSAVSIPSNIAEGYKRNNRKEYKQFLYIAISSAAELETQFIITGKVYPNISIKKSMELLLEVQKMLTRLIQSLSSTPHTL